MPRRPGAQREVLLDLRQAIRASFSIALLVSALVGSALADPGRVQAAALAQNVTRSEFTLALARELHLQPAQSVPQVFSDLPRTSPSFGLIMAAYEAGWISGYPNGTFQPAASLTREQVAKCEVIALGLGTAAAALAGKAPSYADAGQIGRWAWGYVNEAQAIGILRGFSTSAFGPQSTFTEPEIRHAESQMAAYLATTPVKAFAAMPTAARGSAPGTTAIAVTPFSAQDGIAVEVSSIPLSVPTWGAALPRGAVAYSPGSNLAITPGAYVGVYEVASGNVISTFSQLQVTSGEIAEPPAGLALSGPQGGTAASSASIGPFTLTLLDQSGSPAPAPAGGEAVSLASNSLGSYQFSQTASGTDVPSVTVPQGSTSVTFYYGDTAAGAPVLLATSPSLGSATLGVQIAAGAPAKLELSGPASGLTAQSASLGPFTLALVDAYGNPAPAPAGGVDATLASSSPGPYEFALEPGGPSVSSVQIPQGATGQSFYYGDAAQGLPNLAAASPGLQSASMGLQLGSTTATQITLTGPATGAAGTSASNGPFTVTLADANGDPVPAPASGITVTLYSNSSGQHEFTQTPAGVATGSVVIPGGSTSATFYYGDTQPGAVALSATAPGFTSASAMVELATTVNLVGQGLDSFSPPATTPQVEAWYGQGYRNIFLNTYAPTFVQEYAASLETMDVVLFQGYWTSAFTSETGQQRAQQAISAAETVGYPKGAYIFVDVESTGAATEQQMIAWINSWSAAVQAAGYGAGVYFGVPQPVTAQDTTQLLADRFWKSYSGTSITPSGHGVCVVQTGTTQTLDTDTFTTDNLGEYCIGAGI